MWIWPNARNKQMIQIKHNKLKIPTGGRLTSTYKAWRGWIRGHRRQIHLVAGRKIWSGTFGLQVQRSTARPRSPPQVTPN